MKQVPGVGKADWGQWATNNEDGWVASGGLSLVACTSAVVRFQETKKITVGYIAIAGALATSSWMLRSSPTPIAEKHVRNVTIGASSVLALGMGQQALFSSSVQSSVPWLAGAVAAEQCGAGDRGPALADPRDGV